MVKDYWETKLQKLGATSDEVAAFFSCDRSEDDCIVEALRVIRLDRFGKRKKVSSQRKESRKKKQKTSPSYRIRNAMSARMWAAMKGRKDAAMFELLGYTLDDLLSHLESKFVDGMTMENYGKVWHIDHIKPCAMFDLEDKSQFNQCWALSNLQPLFAADNIKKGAKYAGA